MKFWQMAVLGILSGLIGQAGTGGGPLTQEEKNALLSRKEWYVTMEFTLTGQGTANAGTWRYGNRSTVSLVLNNAIPGQWPLSTRTEPDFALQTGRFITWMAMPTEAGFAAAARGVSDPAQLENQYYPAHRSTNESFTVGTKTSTFTGSAGTFAIGPCMLSFDLKEGTYDVVTQVGPTDHGPPIRHEWVDGNRSGVEEAIPTHHLAWLAQEILPQLAKRRIRSDLKADGSIAFSITSPTRVNGFGGPVEATASATFRFSPTPPSKAILTLSTDDPTEYAEWRPIPGTDEDDPGTEIFFLWEVTEPNVPAVQKAKVVKVTFRLGNVSRYPGVCMNWPPQSAGAAPPQPKPDLQFTPQDSAILDDYTVRDEGLVAIIDGDSAEKAKGYIGVESYDGAAIGELVAEAELSDGRILQSVVAGTSGASKILIPEREEGVSDIARFWRSHRASGLADGSDEEQFPAGDAGQGPGDGLTVWEEYRGFFQGGEWRDNCIPRRKDLFVFNKVGAAALDGIELFERITKLVVHDKLLDTEVIPHNVVNFHVRGDRHVVNQNGLYLKEVSGNAGYAQWMPGRSFPGPPKNTMAVRVVMTESMDQVFQLTPNFRVTRNGTSRHIAHELSHAIGVYHHGDRDQFGGTLWFRGTGITIPGVSTPVDRVIEGSPSGPLVEVLLEAGLAPLSNDYIFGVGNSQIKLWIGEKSGQHSGDVNCVMRYVVAQAYKREGAPMTRVIHGTVEPPGDMLCTSQVGTLFNYITHVPQSRYGPADNKRGNCAHQFVISDKFDKQYR